MQSLDLFWGHIKPEERFKSHLEFRCRHHLIPVLVIFLKQFGCTRLLPFHAGDKWFDDVLYSYLENPLLLVLAEPLKELLFRNSPIAHSSELSENAFDLKVGELVIDQSCDQSLELRARHCSTRAVLIVNKFSRYSSSVENLSDSFN